MRGIFLALGVSFPVISGAVAQDTREEQPVSAEREAQCSDRDTVLAQIDREPNRETIGIVKDCIKTFQRQVEAFVNEDGDPLAAYDPMSDSLEFQTRVLMSFGQQFEAGGEFDNSLRKLRRKIDIIEKRIEENKGKFPEEARKNEERLKELRNDYDEQIEVIGNLKTDISERLIRLTQYRPVLINNLELDALEDVIDALKTVTGTVQTTLDNIGNAMDEDARTGN